MRSHSVYNPPLGMAENPTYFEANRILFEAHQLKLQRDIK